MKKLIILISILFSGLTAAISNPNHDETSKFKVSGNCEMCKKRIEGSLKGFNGVKSAVWDVKTKQMTVTYDVHTTSTEAIQKQIASVGHDTEKVKATDASYKNLPGCCQYERWKKLWVMSYELWVMSYELLKQKTLK